MGKIPPNIGDLIERDRVIDQLRSYITSIEHRISGSNIEENHSRLEAHRILQAAIMAKAGIQPIRMSSSRPDLLTVSGGLIDTASDPNSADPFEYVVRKGNGRFGIHPRRGRPGIGLLGPFEGAKPHAIIVNVETKHKDAPPIYYEIDIISDQEQRGLYNTDVLFSEEIKVLFGEGATIVKSLDADETQHDQIWFVRMATKSEPDDLIDFAWAEFSNLAVGWIDEGHVRTKILI